MSAADQKLDREKRSLTNRLLEDFASLRNWALMKFGVDRMQSRTQGKQTLTIFTQLQAQKLTLLFRTEIVPVHSL